MSDFVHLHLHSEYSLLDGACSIDRIPDAVKEAGQSAVAITDHGVMYGCVKFYKACRAAGVKPIIGCEVYVAPGSRFDRTSGRPGDYNHLVLLVKNKIGYENLIYMVSKSFTEGFYSRPRIDLSLLEEHHEGLVALSGCLKGYVAQKVSDGRIDDAEEYAKKLDGIFGRGNFYLELQNQGLEDQMRINETIYGISKRTGIPVVATNDVHYLHKKDAMTQKVLTCIATNSDLADGSPLGFEKDEFYLKSADEMEAVLGKYEGALQNTVKIAQMCDFDFEFDKLYLPRFDVPDGKNPKSYLRELAFAGLARRVDAGDIVYCDERSAEDYKMRIEYELVVISSMGYDEYFLIVADFVNYAKSHGIATGPGRGSGAGSLIAYLIGITEIDPIKFKLLFESFLNPERVAMPDFDIDFCYERRDEVIKYVAQKYGEDHVAQIVTFGTMAAKAAIRDVGRVLGMPYAKVDSVAKAIPKFLGVTLADALEDRDFKALYDSDAEIRNLVDISRAIEGMPRHSSTHAAGVVITDKPVSSYVPLATNGDIPVTQYDMDTIASLGLLKFDFLALRYLTIISDTEKAVKRDDPDFDISKIPLDDEKTYELLSRGKTDGLFQLESGGMKQLLISMKPRSIEDIMIALALYRPGPMDSIPRFLRFRAEPDKISYKLPQLKDILEETNGCIVYQEQIMQIFRTLAGYSYGKADVVRRAISKKKASVVEHEREGFVAGAVRNGIDEETASSVYDEMADFANYGFKKSHAAAYAVLSYRTAYLKAHHTAKYYAALITSVFDNPDKTGEYISDCAKMGIKTLPPDINESVDGFGVSNGMIRFGLSSIKNVGRLFISQIVSEREMNGKFTSFYDFARRMSGRDTNRRQIEFLIKSGAFDGLRDTRKSLLSEYEKLLDMLSSKDRSGVSGQMDLFGSQTVGFSFTPMPEFTKKELLSMEKESVGMYFSGHILDEYSKEIEASRADFIRDIKDAFSDSESGDKKAYSDKSRVTICGIITHRTDKMTKSGEVMTFATLEDRSSDAELVVFPKTLSTLGKSLFDQDRALLVKGEINLRDDDPKIIVREARELVDNANFPENRPADQAPDRERPNTPHNVETARPKVASERPRAVYIRVPSRDSSEFARTLAIVEIFSGNADAIFFCEDEKKYMKSGLKVAPTPFVLRELSEIAGEGSVVAK